MADLNLKWEWPADRQPQFKVVVAIRDVTAANRGWFSIKKSPSLIDGIPDPITLRGTIVSGSAELKGRSVALTLPKLEAGNLQEGDTAAFGLLDNDICICIKKVPSAHEDLSDWKC